MDLLSHVLVPPERVRRLGRRVEADLGKIGVGLAKVGPRRLNAAAILVPQRHAHRDLEEALILGGLDLSLIASLSLGEGSTIARSTKILERRISAPTRASSGFCSTSSWTTSQSSS